MLSKTLAALAAAACLPLLNGCGLDDVNQGSVRLVNATTEYPTMDLYDVNSKNESELLVSGTASFVASPYSKLDAGSYTFNLVGAGGSSTAATVPGSVAKTDHYAVVTYLTGGALQTQFLSEEEDAPTSGNAKLRVLNGAASEAGSVDVYVTSHACNALADTDTAFATGVSGLQASFGQVLAASAGTQWNVCVTAGGNKQSLLLAIAALTFTDGQVSTLILTHTSGGVLLNGAVLDQQGALKSYANSLARVRLVADAAGSSTKTAPPIAANINGTALATSAASPTVGAYATVTVPASGTASTTTLSMNGVALADPGLMLAAGADYTLLIAGSAAAPTIALIPDNNTPSTSTALPVKMRLVNGVNGLAAATSLSSDGTVVADGVSFGAASSYQNVAAATDSADIVASAGGVVLWEQASTTLASGSVNTVFLLGDYVPTASPPVTFVLRQDRAPAGVSVAASSASN